MLRGLMDKFPKSASVVVTFTFFTSMYPPFLPVLVRANLTSSPSKTVTDEGLTVMME